MINDGYLACVESGSQSAPTEVLVSESDRAEVAKRFFSGKHGAAGKSNLAAANNKRRARSLLEPLTADLNAFLKLHLQYKVYEWTIDGPSWFVHRSLFVDLGSAVSRSIDLVAERIVALGGSPAADTDGRAIEAKQRTSSAVHDSPQTMLTTLRQAEREIVEQLDYHIRLARANEDYGTRDVLSHLRTKHARHLDELAAFTTMDSAPNHSKRANAGAVARRNI